MIFARQTMDDMGYSYVAFGRFHFEDDLQYKDAVPMLMRLMELAEGKGLSFGVKLTNTFLWMSRNELPSKGNVYVRKIPLRAFDFSCGKAFKDFGGRLKNCPTPAGRMHLT